MRPDCSNHREAGATRMVRWDGPVRNGTVIVRTWNCVVVTSAVRS